MDFTTFETTARAAFDAIPDEFREGLDGLVIERRAEPHPSHPGIYTLGVCDTEEYPSDWSGPETLRSTVHLYYGSFKALARADDDFDWAAEIHETVEHEVRHHLEALAGEDQLGGVDAAMDQLFRRGQGESWDPWLFQSGERAGRGVWVVEDHVFLEMEIGLDDDPKQISEIVADWQGRRFSVPMPHKLGDLTYILLAGLGPEPPFVELVLTQQRSWWARARSIFQGSMTSVMEYEAQIEWLDGPGSDSPDEIGA